MPSPIVAVEGLAKHFGAVEAVAGLSFSLGEGETVALLGGNGAGKTTTLSMLLGLLLPDAGRIAIFGETMPATRHRVLARMNFSSPYVDLPQRLTVRENLTVYGHLYALDGVRARIESLAADLDLGAFLERPLRGLSTGQKTRVALAKALLNEPALLLLDEPTASLDPDTGDWVRGYLEAWRKRSGATILLASHNMGEVERLCDRVLMMRGGRIVDEGPPAGLIARYGRTTLEEVFLDIARGRKGEAP